MGSVVNECKKKIRRLILFTAILFVVGLARLAEGQCDLQIVAAGPCLADGTPGTPAVEDANYGLRVTLNVVGAPSAPFRIQWVLASVTNYFDDIFLDPGDGYWFYFLYPLSLDDPIPWSVTLDPDGVSGDTNLANNTASGTFTPIPPSAPAQFYAPRVLHGSENFMLGFEPGSGAIPNLYVVSGAPTSHGAQNVITATGPSNSQTILTPPYGAPLYQNAWSNAPAATFQGTETFTVQLSRSCVNPGLLRTNTWADMSALSTNWTQWLAPDPIAESTNPLVIAFVQASLPTNYQTTLTPYDTARALHQAVMKRLSYLSPPFDGDAVGVLQDGVADCGGFSALLTASLRYVGIPARRISGFRQGDSDWHVRVEFHLPGVEWLEADPTDGNSVDTNGNFAYYFGDVNNSDSFLAVDVGDSHVLSYGDFTFIQIANWWWNGGATYQSYDSASYLQPNGVLSLTNFANGSIQLLLNDPPTEGSVVIQASSNLVNWWPIATNAATGNPLTYSFPSSNQPAAFYRAQVAP